MFEVIKSLFFASVFLLVITAIYFIALEQWRRKKCKAGQHAGHIKDGKLVCHTCFAEVDLLQ
jgi:hypothetical protein